MPLGRVRALARSRPRSSPTSLQLVEGRDRAAAVGAGSEPSGIRQNGWRRPTPKTREGPWRSGPDKPYPLGATYDGTGVNFAVFSEVAERVELCLIDDDGDVTETRVDLPEVDGFVWHGYVPVRAARAALRLPGPRPLRPGARPPVQPDQAAARPLRQGDRGAGRRTTSRSTPTPSATPTPRPRSVNTDDSLRHTMLSVVINPFFDWGNDRPPRHEYHETRHLRGARQGPDHAAPRRSPRRSAAPTPAIAHPAIIEHLTSLGHHRHRAHARAPVRPGPAPRRPGPVELLGLQHHRLLRPAQRVRRPAAQRGQQVLEFKAMVKALHEADIEVILDVVYNHTAEGNHLGPTLAFRGLDNHSYYRLVSDDLAHYYDTTGTGNSPPHAQPARAAAHHGLAALLGHGDARRRLPLRPRRDAGPPVPRGRQAVARSSTSSSRTRSSARSSSSRSRGTSARAATRSAGFPPLWTEWNGKYRDTVRDFWRGEAARSASSPPASPAPATSTSTPAASRSRRSTSSRPRRVHAARPRVLQREAQRGQRRGQQRRREPQPVAGTAASRGRPTTPRSARCARGSSATSSPPCCSRRACR